MPAPGDWAGLLPCCMINCGGNQRRLERFDGRERLQVDGRKRERGKLLDMLMHVVLSASGARHRCKESRRCETLSLRYQNRRFILILIVQIGTRHLAV